MLKNTWPFNRAWTAFATCAQGHTNDSNSLTIMPGNIRRFISSCFNFKSSLWRVTIHFTGFCRKITVRKPKSGPVIPESSQGLGESSLNILKYLLKLNGLLKREAEENRSIHFKVILPNIPFVSDSYVWDVRRFVYYLKLDDSVKIQEWKRLLLYTSGGVSVDQPTPPPYIHTH